MQTSNPDIYAIGDVAAFPLTNYGLNKMFRQEHVQNCRQSAKHAGTCQDPRLAAGKLTQQDVPVMQISCDRF